MSWKFNAPPGWPTPPEGFTPPPGWAPQSSWPPPPAGWQFWVWADSETPGQVPPHREVGASPSGSPEFVTPSELSAASRDAAPSAPTASAPPLASRPSIRTRLIDRANARASAVQEADRRRQAAFADELAAAARLAAAGDSRVPGFQAKSGEQALAQVSANLIEPKVQPGHYTGGYSGVSIRVAKRVSYRIGGTRGRYVPGTEVQTPTDSGAAVITTTRVVFLGSRNTREWQYSKLVGVDSSADDRTVLLHVSNRQRVSGLHLRSDEERFQGYLALGMAIHEHGAEAVAAEWGRAAAAGTDSPVVPAPAQKHAWYLRSGWIAALLIVFAPLGIALTWTTSAWRRPTRILVTVASLALFLTALAHGGGRSPSTTAADRGHIAPATSTATAPSTAPATRPQNAGTVTPSAIRAKPTVAPSPTAAASTTHVVAPPAATRAPATTRPVSVPHATPSVAPSAVNTCGAPANPFGYTFCGGGVITNPQPSVCNYFDCIANFWNGTGYMVECSDATYSMSGGRSGACSHHGGELRTVYQP